LIKEDFMKPKPYAPTAVNISPFLGPKKLNWLTNTDEFFYRIVFYPLIDRNDFDIYSDIKSRPGTRRVACFSSIFVQLLPKPLSTGLWEQLG